MSADEAKARGNAALQAGKTTEAIEHYTQAIRLDGSNHVFYSNRSAAYLKQGDANNALEDAESCIGLNPNFAKGYSRKGAALHALKRYNDSIKTYTDALEKFPNDAGLTKGLEQVQKEKDGPSLDDAVGGGLFNPTMMARLAMDPKMSSYLNDPELMAKVKLIQSNPNMLPTMMNDPKMMSFLGAMMGQPSEAPGTSTTATSQSQPPAPAAPEPMEETPVEEDWSQLTPEERAKKEKQRDSMAAKSRGNDLFKEKKYAEALEAYDEAISIDDTNMTFLNNKAAVYFNQKKYDECIEMCLAAVEVGKSNMAPFEDRAKALTRCAKAYQKMGDLAKAIEYCNAAQLESYDKNTQRLLKTLELEKRKADKLAYQDDEKAEEAKQRGNDHFRAKKWGEAVAEYEEAVKRAPKNAPIRNNLAAALCKIMDFNGAKREIDVAVELDPNYVKAWARKGDIEMMMKESHKAMESYRKGLAIDPSNAACSEGLRKVNAQIGSNMSDEERKERAAHAMADPEIQAIVNDPIIRQVLEDFGSNPTAAQQAMRDPVVASKIEKLVAAGILQTR